MFVNISIGKVPKFRASCWRFDECVHEIRIESTELSRISKRVNFIKLIFHVQAQNAVELFI